MPEQNSLTNPFSTRFIRPGAVPYLAPKSRSIEFHIELLEQFDWLAQITGPHGSGKSTFLSALISHKKMTKEVIEIPFDRADNETNLKQFQDKLVVIDGFEKVSWWARKKLIWNARKSRAGLLVTSHQSIGLKTLIECRPALENLRYVVDFLLEKQSPSEQPFRVSDQELARLDERHRGNFRDVLFELYDQYEEHKKS